MAKRNKHPGKCPRCDKRVAKNEGFVERFREQWGVRCRDCVGKGHVQLEKSE